MSRFKQISCKEDTYLNRMNCAYHYSECIDEQGENPRKQKHLTSYCNL